VRKYDAKRIYVYLYNAQGSLITRLILRTANKNYVNNINNSDQACSSNSLHLQQRYSLPFLRLNLYTGTLPADWKTANIVPIFKKGDRTDRANYRPVSLTYVPCKIMESIIKDKLMGFLESNDLLCKEQHGFRSGRSCLTNLLETFENWTKTLDEEFGLDVLS